MTKLILVRHGKSEWNDKGLWTGWTDVDLNEIGIAEARHAGEALSDIPVHRAHVSALKRAQQTLHHIKEALAHPLETLIHPALNERHYGIYTGKNKWQMKEELGEEAFQNLRRGWDVPIPEGESLKQVHARVIPYFESTILPDIQNGLNTLVVAHGNSLRALVKHLENIEDHKICDVELGTGELHCYELGPDGEVIDKEIRAANPHKKQV